MGMDYQQLKPCCAIYYVQIILGAVYHWRDIFLMRRSPAPLQGMVIDRTIRLINNACQTNLLTIICKCLIHGRGESSRLKSVYPYNRRSWHRRSNTPLNSQVPVLYHVSTLESGAAVPTDGDNHDDTPNLCHLANLSGYSDRGGSLSMRR